MREGASSLSKLDWDGLGEVGPVLLPDGVNLIREKVAKLSKGAKLQIKGKAFFYYHQIYVDKFSIGNGPDKNFRMCPMDLSLSPALYNSKAAIVIYLLGLVISYGTDAQVP